MSKDFFMKYHEESDNYTLYVIERSSYAGGKAYAIDLSRSECDELKILVDTVHRV